MKKYRTIHGDCFEILKQMAERGERFDAIITDPPYSANLQKVKRSKGVSAGDTGMDNFVDGKKRKYVMPSDAINDQFKPFDIDRMDEFFESCVKVCSGWILIFCDELLLSHWIDAGERNDYTYRNYMVWYKTNGRPSLSGQKPANSCELIPLFCKNLTREVMWNGRGGRNLIEDHDLPKAIEEDMPDGFDSLFKCSIKHGAERRESGGHATPKPVQLMEHLVKLFTKPGNMILDPFMGSGSTGVAALHNGRLFTGIEIDEQYVKVSEERLSKQTDYGTKELI